jgi:hypothetical protein
MCEEFIAGHCGRRLHRRRADQRRVVGRGSTGAAAAISAAFGKDGSDAGVAATMASTAAVFGFGAGGFFGSQAASAMMAAKVQIKRVMPTSDVERRKDVGPARPDQ